MRSSRSHIQKLQQVVVVVRLDELIIFHNLERRDGTIDQRQNVHGKDNRL